MLKSEMYGNYEDNEGLYKEVMEKKEKRERKWALLL